MIQINYAQLSKTVSHALRHEPWLYEIEIDEEGWCDIAELLTSLRCLNNEWSSLTINDLNLMIVKSDKKRHEIKGDKIRALYGHTIPYKLKKIKQEPPEVLYHGTSPEAAKQILTDGLRPMQRQFVHLSTDKMTAAEVGRRKTSEPIILEIFARDAYSKGNSFYIGNENVWLADYIPNEFIKKLD